MQRISIQDLKARLSSVVAQAEAGATILITRHNEPVAQLCPPGPQKVHLGRALGVTRLRPAVRRATKGRYLSVLIEDRGER
jgi:prevent-host-death family protein